jgi:hypothetical protein
VEGFSQIVFSILFPSVIPLCCALYLGWCVFRLTSKTDSPPPESRDHDPRRWRRAPRRPRGPRRGPHAPSDARAGARRGAHAPG